MTPGGHRRYARTDLERFLTSHTRLLGVKDLASHLEASLPVHRQMDAALVRAMAGHGMNAEAQFSFALLGRQMLTLIVKSVTDPARREELLPEIRKVGVGLGDMTALSGMSLTDAIHVFISHREPLMRAVAEMMKKGEGVQRRVADAIPLIDQAMDAGLMALVEAYQKEKKMGKPA